MVLNISHDSLDNLNLSALARLAAFKCVLIFLYTCNLSCSCQTTQREVAKSCFYQIIQFMWQSHLQGVPKKWCDVVKIIWNIAPFFFGTPCTRVLVWTSLFEGTNKYFNISIKYSYFKWKTAALHRLTIVLFNCKFNTRKKKWSGQSGWFVNISNSERIPWSDVYLKYCNLGHDSQWQTVLGQCTSTISAIVLISTALPTPTSSNHAQAV